MLWDDTRVEGVSERGYELVNPAFFYVNRLIVTDIRDEYEARIAELEAEVKRLQGEVVGLRQSLQIADIVERANGMWERWEPVAADHSTEQDGKLIVIENQGEWVGICRVEDKERDGGWRGVWLDELGFAVCRKVQP